MTNTQKRSLYESIMKDVAKTVKRHLNEDDEDDMQNTNINLGPLSKYQRDLYDRLYKHNFDEEYACNMIPSERMDDNELLKCYVLGLYVFKCDCPKNIKDVMSTGILKNYILKYIERNLDIENILKKYYK